MNRTHVIQQAYEQYKNAAYGRHLKLCELLERAAAGESQEYLAAELIAIEVAIEVDALPLIRAVSMLQEHELIELLRCSPEQYAAWRQEDPDLSDLVQFKHDIYRYIVSPSPSVAAAHAQHVSETNNVGSNNSSKPTPFNGST